MLVFVVIQFYGQLPRQLKSGDKAVDGGILRNAILCVDDPEHQPTLRLSQRLAKCSVALLNFLLLRREFGWGIKKSYRSFSSLYFMRSPPCNTNIYHSSTETATETFKKNSGWNIAFQPLFWLCGIRGALSQVN